MIVLEGVENVLNHNHISDDSRWVHVIEKVIDYFSDKVRNTMNLDNRLLFTQSAEDL